MFGVGVNPADRVYDCADHASPADRLRLQSV